MPKRVHPHNAELQRLLHGRGMTLVKLCKQMAGAKTHVHLCQVLNARRQGKSTMRKLAQFLTAEELRVLLAFRKARLGPDCDRELTEELFHMEQKESQPTTATTPTTAHEIGT